MQQQVTLFTKQAGVCVPIIGGPMYPCSNPELVAAVSEAGGLGVVQPLSLVFVYGHEFRTGLRYIRSLTGKPIGMNVLIEKSSKVYEDRMRAWVDSALEEGVRFFITSLGNPRWVVERVHHSGGVVYHDVTETKWADKAVEAGVDGLICVNQRAGGHAGNQSIETLYDELKDYGKPLICAGGVGDEQQFVQAMQMGYAGVQMGTRFIATTECQVHADYKQAILNATEKDIVLTDKLSGTPCAIIKTPYIEKLGTESSSWAKKLLKHPKTKYLMRTLYALSSVWKLKQASLKGRSYRDFWQAGKSVATIHEVESVEAIIKRFANAYAERNTPVV